MKENKIKHSYNYNYNDSQVVLGVANVDVDAAVLLFSKLNKIFFGYIEPENIFLDNENK